MTMNQIDSARHLYACVCVCVCVVSRVMFRCGLKCKGGAGREAKNGEEQQEQGLQDWNPNAPRLRHEGNESGCLKNAAADGRTDHDPPSENTLQRREAHTRTHTSVKSEQKKETWLVYSFFFFF